MYIFMCRFSSPGFPIQKLQSRVLHLHVFDYDRFSRDDSIGEMFLPLCQVIWRDVPARKLCGSIITRGRCGLRDSHPMAIEFTTDKWNLTCCTCHVSHFASIGFRISLSCNYDSPSWNYRLRKYKSIIKNCYLNELTTALTVSDKNFQDPKNALLEILIISNKIVKQS